MAGATEFYRGNKQIVGTWPSGSPTASAVQSLGAGVFGLSFSGALNSGFITLQAAVTAGATIGSVYDLEGALLTAAPPGGGTGIKEGWNLDSDFMKAWAGYGVLTVSGAPQTAKNGITVIWSLKG